MSVEEMFHPTTGCRTDQLFGIWLMEFDVLDSLVMQAKAIDLKWLAERNDAAARALESPGTAADKPTPPPPPKPYVLHEGGVGELVVKGAITKYPTSFSSLFGGSSVVGIQSAMRKMLADDEVKSLLMTVESPGGSPHGLWDLGRDMRKANDKKPLMTRIQDTGNSGGYLLAAHSPRIAANENANVGSIGVFSQLIDQSGKLEKEGIKVIPILSGRTKGLGMTPGVSKEQVAEAQRRSDELWNLFADTVGENRHLTRQYVKSLEARVLLGESARKAGLVDAIESHEETLDRLRHASSTRTVISVPVDSHGVTDPSKQQAAVTQGATMPQDLLAKIRELSGNPTLSEDEAAALITSTHSKAKNVDELQSQITTLKANQKPEPMPANLLDGFKKVAKSEIKLATKAGTITDAQEAQLSAMVDSDPQVVAVPDDKGDSMISKFLSTSAMAPKGVKTGEKSKEQPAALKTVDPNPQNTDEYSMLDEATDAVVNQYKQKSPMVAGK